MNDIFKDGIGRKATGSFIGLLLSALAPFTTDVEPSLAFKGAVGIIIVYMFVNLVEKFIHSK